MGPSRKLGRQSESLLSFFKDVMETNIRRRLGAIRGAMLLIARWAAMVASRYWVGKSEGRHMKENERHATSRNPII